MVDLLLKDDPGQAFQTLFPRHDCAGAAFLLIRTVNILQRHERFCAVDRRGQLLRHLPLTCDRRADRRPAILQIPEIGETFTQVPDLFIVQLAVLLLTVTRDERNGVALIDQADDGFRLPWLNMQFFRDLFCYLHLVCSILLHPSRQTARCLQRLHPDHHTALCAACPILLRASVSSRADPAASIQMPAHENALAPAKFTHRREGFCSDPFSSHRQTGIFPYPSLL